MLLAACSSTQLTQAEAQDRTADLEQKISDKKFVFEATEALPMGGRTRQLTTYYGLKVSHDTLESTLPYFGRAYAAPMNPSDAGYIFTSTQYDMQVSKRDNGWDITIVPQDRHNGEKFVLTAFNNGTANLQVNSNNRQPITFRGRIR